MPGLGAQGANERARDVQVGLAAAEEVLQPDELARGQQRKMLADERAGDRESGRALGQHLQLEQQALLERPRPDAGRIQGLHEAQRRRQVVGLDAVLFGNGRGELGEAELEVTVVVERVDHQMRECTIAFAHLREQELPAQMIAGA